MADRGGLDAIQHIVVLMLASRSFDHMLGFLYTAQGNISAAGQAYDGLTGSEFNLDPAGEPVTVFPIEPTDSGAYFMPGADPGDDFQDTNAQLFGTTAAPYSPSSTTLNSGFVESFGDSLARHAQQGTPIGPGTSAKSIMGCFSPEALPVLSGLAKGYAVCDQWFSSVPSGTRPNRFFACSATSQGHLDNTTVTIDSPTIFGLLESHGLSWSIFGYNSGPLTRRTFADVAAAPDGRFGLFADFTAAAAAGTLAAFTFLEPSWGSTGNSQHPSYNVALGERLISDVYQALRNGPGWPQTLLVITYDTHGGCYDHVSPPWGAVPPDNLPGESGFDFTRFGVRVPAVLVSPLIAAETVFRGPAGSMSLDHTSILKTVQLRWGLPALTARDAAAPDFGGVLTLSSPRTDDVLADVAIPVPQAVPPASGIPAADGDADLPSGRESRPVRPKAQLTSDSWTTDDKLGYSAYADAIATFICHPDTEPPLTIGIKGPWGSGKTSLMHMVEQRLDPQTNGRRQQILLTARSREKVSPRWRRRRPARDDAEPPRVNNREVLEQARQSEYHESSPAFPLRADPPADEETTPRGIPWRPTVWFNPWMYQSGEQIWAGFAYEIISQVTRRLPAGDRERFWLRLNLARLDRAAVRSRAYRLLLERLVPVALAGAAFAVLALVALGLARLAPQLASSLHRAAGAAFSAGALAAVVGTVVQAVRFGGESASVAFGGLVSEPAVLSAGIRKEAAGLFAGSVADPDYSSRTGFLHLVNTDMRRVLDLVATPSRPLVVFVDDLDRCSPGPVVQVIEAVNLFLAGEFPNCIFVLAMEPDVVAADIEVAYKDQMARLSNRPTAHGWDTLGWRFLEKIVQLPLSLPPVAARLQENFVRGLLNVPISAAAASVPAGAPAAGRPGGEADGGQAATASEGPRTTPDATIPRGPQAAPAEDIDPAFWSPDAALIADISARIWARHPDLDSLDAIARDVQAQMIGPSDRLTDATMAAINRVFADLYSDREAFAAIESALPALGSTNPREIKRYINLFRFYTFIAYRKQLSGGPALGGEQIARLAVLAIRWPDLLSTLMQTGDDGQTYLLTLTRAASEKSDGSTAAGGAAWPRLLIRIGLGPGDPERAGRWDDLRWFLAAAEGIVEAAEQLI